MKEESGVMPHNGDLLKQQIAEQRVVKVHLAQKMNVSPPCVNVYLTHKSLQASILWNASKALQHNFLAELGESVGVAYETKAEAQLREELAALQKEMEKLKMKVSIYEGMMKK